MLTALQLLFGFRGENRCTRLVGSSRRTTLSIQPKLRAWSTASDHVIVGLPDAREWKMTPISVAVAWFSASQPRKLSQLVAGHCLYELGHFCVGQQRTCGRRTTASVLEQLQR